ncbi:hypothetical protein [Microbacterium ureisolvens]|uniref:Uncharacterized protein n=1 Tax=Microbacterium ureisolvens TaxID=2781186 RepID=A0ABS7I2R3_9MICO|nr:hypothetical protein [Microbacterium ureisolvens]MBW9111122.1 hypothetical protein [Microbacterium ureisolvens]
MVLERPSSPARRGALRSRAVPGLHELPPRRPQPPAPDDSTVRWERIDIDRYEVRASGVTVGFIDVVGAVFVVLAGPRYDRAVEALQTLDFAVAVDAITPADTERPIA